MLKHPPSSLRGGYQRQLYEVSAMVLAASEDKTHRGAFVAAPNMPWIWGNEDPSGPYHLVWSRDLYQIATALIAAGDTAGANRALQYLFTVQQKPDGSFPQNSRVDGTPVWTGLQLDEVAFPIVLAYQLRRTDPATWSHVERAADFLIGFSQDGNRAPWSPQDRWENQSGYSPATIASEIAGLVCAAYIARVNGDAASARRYLATADDWQARVKGWTVTTTGPYSAGPYFLRVTKDGKPNAGTTYDIGDSGPSNVDQRRVVDPSYLDLVRLGVLPADDPAVVNTLRVVDAQLGVRTDRGFFWHRASFDGYGEKTDGGQWEFGLPNDSFITRGRAWPLLNGERGEYQIAAGDLTAARGQLTTMARAAGPGYMLPEQVWDQQPACRHGRVRARDADVLGDPAGLDARAVHQAGVGRQGREGARAAEDRGAALRRQLRPRALNLAPLTAGVWTARPSGRRRCVRRHAVAGDLAAAGVLRRRRRARVVLRRGDGDARGPAEPLGADPPSGGSLGVVLFVRTNRRLVLTDAGRLLLPRARAALVAAEEAVDVVRPVRSLTGGTVSFGTFSSAHHFLLVDLVTLFRERYPAVRVRVLGRNSAEVADAVREGTLEAGLVALPVDTQGLDVTPPVWTAEVVCASADPCHTGDDHDDGPSAATGGRLITWHSPVMAERSLAIELAADGIAVSAIAPGWVATAGILAGGRIQEAAKAVPLGRAAEPEEIADWVWKLGSVPGSYLTGETVVVSGGLLLR